jgi:hypothetical protein
LERKMADRNQTNEQSTSKSPKPAPSDRTNAGRDDGVEQNPDPGSEKSGASRPRGQTEDPERTL